MDRHIPLAAFAVLVVLAVGIALTLNNTKPPVGVVGDVHEHADFKVYLDGVPFNFSQARYMSTENRSLSPFLHLHDMDGEILHKHANGAVLSYFFNSLRMTFNSTCFVTDAGARYCDGGGRTLKMLVNGVPDDRFGSYEPHDLDRILISYGNETPEQVRTQMDSVTSNACIESNKCPEKGKPTDESSCSSDRDCVADQAPLAGVNTTG